MSNHGEDLVASSMQDANSEDNFVIFADGSENNMAHLDHIVDSQHLSIGDDGITIVVTPDNEHQVTELLRALQASQSDSVQIVTEPDGQMEQQQPSQSKEDESKKKRVRSARQTTSAAEAMKKKAKLIELALQEADASVAEGVSNLKSSRLREKAAKQGGLKKLWLAPKDDSLDDNVDVETDPYDLKTDEEENYNCDLCPEGEFPSLEDLKNHRKEVHQATFHCDLCGVGFEDQIGFFEHLKTHYEKPKKVRGRPRKVATPNAPVASTSKAEDSNSLTCETCSKEFRNSKALDAHIRNAHPDAVTKAYHCAQCNTSFRFKEAMETHMENVHGAAGQHSNDSTAEGASMVNIIKSEAIDEKDFAEMVGVEDDGEDGHGDLEGDGEEHHIGDDEEGDDDEIDNEEDLETLQGVTDYDPAIDGHCCQLCGAVFSAKKRLIQHLKEDHHIGFRRGRRPKYPPVETAEDGSFPCNVCQRTFTHKNSLAYHVRTHVGDRPHQCEICGKSFFANGALKVHMRVHTGARPYKCTECPSEFRQWGDLKYHHTSKHSGVKQYQCEFCGKSFARKYSLIVHRRVHTGERNYKCDFCNKGFRASSYLLNHRRIHTGEKPHPCPVCSKAFRMRSDMKRHMQMHARDGSDVSLLLSCSEPGTETFESITADPEALAALREKMANEGGGKRNTRRVTMKHGKSEEATAVATIQDDDDGEGSVMLTIIPNEDGEMVAVPIHVRDDDGSKSMSLVESADSHEGQVQELQLINEDGEVQEGAMTMRDPDTNTLYVWSVFPNK